MVFLAGPFWGCAAATEAGTAGRRGPGLPGGVSVGCAAARAGRTKPAAHCGVRRRRGGAERLPTVGAADYASPGVAACAAATGCGCEWRWFRRRPIELQMRRRVLSGLRGSIPALGEADHKLLHAWAWGTEPQPISPGQLQCLLQSILAEPHRSAKRKTDPAHKRRTSRQPALAALQAATRKSGSVIHGSLNTIALTQRSAHQSALRSPRSTHHHHPTRHSTWPTTPSPTS